MTRVFSPSAVLLALAALFTPAAVASAAERPYEASGAARFVSPTGFVGSGHATHLGRYTETGSATFSPTANPAVLAIDARSVYTAANGDQLHAVITGELIGLTGAITATVTYVGGTGRFAGAGGSATLTGHLRPDGSIAVAVSGTIDY